MNKFISSVILLIVAIGLSFTFTKSNFSKINELDEDLTRRKIAALESCESTQTGNFSRIILDSTQRDLELVKKIKDDVSGSQEEMRKLSDLKLTLTRKCR